MVTSTIDLNVPAAQHPLSAGAIRAQFARAANDIENLLTASAASSTGHFRSNDGARIVKLNDRLFVGAATDNDGAKPNIATDWLTDLVNWPVYNGTSAFVSPNGGVAVTAGSQTLGFDPVEFGTTQTTIGFAAFAMANNPGTYPDDFFSAYAFYGEGRTYPGTVSNAFAAELEAINMRGEHDSDPTPYRELTLSATHALRLGSGGGQDLDPYDAQAAISIVPNGAKFRAGIVFEKGALAGADGTTGFGTAMSLGLGHMLSWYYDDSSTGERATFITSTATQPVDSLQFQNGALLLVSPAGKITASWAVVEDAVNGLGFLPAVAGQAPTLETFGDDTNVDLKIKPKGAGNIAAYCNTLLFYSDGGSQLAGLVNGATDPTKMTTLEFNDYGAFVYSQGAGVLFSVSRVASAVNYVSVYPSVTGSAVSFRATGADANVDLVLQGKGTGTVGFEAPNTTSATAGGASALPGDPAGYVTLNINGALKKMPYWNA